MQNRGAENIYPVEVEFARRLGNASHPTEFHRNDIHKLRRTYTTLMDALKRHRDQSGPTVQNVSVRDRGQAIVGNDPQRPRGIAGDRPRA